MIDTRHIYPLSDFVRNAEAYIARLKETKKPLVLTVNGRAEIVMLDIETYEDMMKQLQRGEAISTT